MKIFDFLLGKHSVQKFFGHIYGTFGTFSVPSVLSDIEDITKIEDFLGLENLDTERLRLDFQRSLQERYFRL